MLAARQSYLPLKLNAGGVMPMSEPLHRPVPPLPPGSWLGLLGGGQLGRMFAHAAQQMGFFTAVLDPDATSPAGRISHHHVQTAYTDPEGLARLAGTLSAAGFRVVLVSVARARAPRLQPR